MPVTNPRVDACTAKSAPFAQPILGHIRGFVHSACPTRHWKYAGC